MSAAARATTPTANVMVLIFMVSFQWDAGQSSRLNSIRLDDGIDERS